MSDLSNNIANILTGTHGWGPLTVGWNIDIAGEQVTADATLHGANIGHIVINKANPNAKLGGAFMGSDIECDLAVDFATKTLDYETKVSFMGIKLYDHAGKLLTW